MRVELTRQVPGIPVLDGSAERIPLPDAAVDVVVVAQAFHWFDAPKALREISRVLRPGGGLSLVWNERDETVEWVHELSLAMKWPDYQPYAVGMDFRPVLVQGELFEDVERHQFRFQQLLDRRRLLLRVESTSYITALPMSERDDLMAPVRELVAKLTEPIHLPYRTDLYICRRADLADSGNPGRPQ
jgi:SAM-dependent methyltransferase